MVLQLVKTGNKLKRSELPTLRTRALLCQIWHARKEWWSYARKVLLRTSFLPTLMGMTVVAHMRAVNLQGPEDDVSNWFGQCVNREFVEET